ncbi:MAG: hypothetical protein JWO43_494 [Candidatus Adlerbacteria bacterium]|nr:hypothetical protein [Candidatus Adlerbacteria bacterium]
MTGTCITTAEGAIRGINSWTQGFIALKPPRRVKFTEEEVLRLALILERQGKKEEAEDVLDQFFAGNLIWHRV